MTELMSDRRHETLVKAAEECIDLMNIGADPDAALRQVKKAFDMNDNEVVLVSHAVNNSKQLANLQNGGKDKGAPFPLTNADSATGANSDADLDTLGANTKAKEEQPDAVEIADKVKKEASADSYVTKGSYRKVAIATSDMVADLQAAWGKAGPAMDVTDLGNPYDSVNAIKIAAEQARTTSAQLRDQACANLDTVAQAFTVSGGPSFAAFEKAASAAGITAELIDIIYDLGPADLEQARNLDKTAADRLFVSAEIMTLLKIAETADAQWQQSSDYEAARLHLLDQVRTEEVKLGQVAWEIMSEAYDKAKDLSEATSADKENVNTLFPLDPEGVKALGPQQPESSTTPLGQIIDYKTQQQLNNSRARSQVESLLQDEFIGKHNTPEVVESYNRAISVNPDFGDAELTAFIRQDLASQKAIPLDLLIRASNAHTRRDVAVA